jgi:hypothetical protein
MAFFCPGTAHGSARKKSAQMGSKLVSLSQGTSPVTPGPASSLDSEKGTTPGGKPTTGGDITITLPHSNTQSMIKKLIVVQKYEPKPGEKGLAVGRGESVLLVRDDGEWMYVRNEAGDEGFVPRSHLLSPSRTRTRTTSRSGTALRHVASNGSVSVHSTRPPHQDQPSALSQDEGHHNHITSNGRNYHHHPNHLPRNEILYDRKVFSPSPSSGVASSVDQFSPGPTHSPMPDRGIGGGGGRERAESSSSSLEHSHGSCSSCDQALEGPAGPHRPTLVSPLNHIEGGRENFPAPGARRGGANENTEGIPRSNSTSSRSTGGDSASVRQQPLVQNGIHYVDKTTNHIYSTLEQPTSPPPPPLPPRNMPAFSASQEPEQNVYSQLEHTAPGSSGGGDGGGGGGVYRACSQEALVHPSHHHNSFSEGWTRDRKIVSNPARSGSARSRAYKEVVEIRQNASPQFRQRAAGPPPPRTAAGARSEALQQHRHHQQQNRRNETKITKFRKMVWGVFVVTHNFDPLDENEISVREGEHVSVWNQDDRDWFWVVRHASSGQEEGFVPSACLREVSADSKTSVRCESGRTLSTLFTAPSELVRE